VLLYKIVVVNKNKIILMIYLHVFDLYHFLRNI